MQLAANEGQTSESVRIVHRWPQQGASFVAGRIAARGEVAYLHAYESSAAAIGLYESIGFRLRSMMNMAVVQRAG
ncbi:GNAT family N-acetyltransferase [Mesorhizobium sp. VK2B]|uniref:GNAT family N-acetyltransferase n=1 Tax=Mesorhizobium humile TaxID=3072313 RepID=A0ABU4YBQ7_9HYPH|nr:GNAT family N-acetyltransferase [Mesorhizobium sp. VK2D]MDX8483575.1 GNAT family N-acetyltransferase [Mesorhizobium sp. VK2B]